MNLKTWFKGLGVFVASSFITSLAAANLSPSTFNFSKQGLSKLATLAAIVGIKAVVLYLKQSPLPANGAATNWSKISGALVLVLALPLTGLVSGCVSGWEQDTYATLATGKALIDCAVAGYNHADADIRTACAARPDAAAFDATKFYIPQTRAAQQAIETARQAQVACVEAFEAYAVAKVAKDKTVSLAQKQAAVTGYLAQLPALLNAVRALVGSPTSPTPPTSHPMTRNTGAPWGPPTSHPMTRNTGTPWGPPTSHPMTRNTGTPWGPPTSRGIAGNRLNRGSLSGPGGMNATDIRTVIPGLEANREECVAPPGVVRSSLPTQGCRPGLDSDALSGLDLIRVDRFEQPDKAGDALIAIDSLHGSIARLVHFKLEPIQFRSPDHPISGSPDAKEVSRGQ